MKKIIFISLIVCIISDYTYSQSLRWVEDSVMSEQIPVGLCTWNDFSSHDFFAEMQQFYEVYQPQNVVLKQIADLLKENEQFSKWEVTIVFGAWCSDSREQLPAWKKIADQLQTDYQVTFSYRLIGCDRSKQTDIAEYDTLVDTLFSRVPAFIFEYVIPENPTASEKRFVKGLIEETPNASIEDDMLLILQQNIK